MQSKKGFTLIELVIVLAVIAILLGVIIPAYKGMQEEGQYSEAEAELNTLKTAVISYYRHNGSYPSNIHSVLTAASPKIITETLDDPFKTDASTTPNTYGYNYGTESGFGDWFYIYSKGPDLVGGTSFDTNDDRVEKSSANGKDDIVVSNAAIYQN